VSTQPVHTDFYRYPPVGEEDWRYAYAVGRVRVLESLMLSYGTLADMAHAEDFAAAVESLAGTEYAVSAETDEAHIESMLLERRSEVRRLIVDMLEDADVIEMFRAREDFANMRLALRRVVTERPLGLDYSDEGAIPAGEFEEIFQQEYYDRLPDYLREAVEAAVLGYYENKDIRRIDHEIDRVEARWRVRRSVETGRPFCEALARIRIDLNNIRTMLRLKADGRDERQFFLPDGYLEPERFVQALDQSYDGIVALFAATPYAEVIDEGVRYLRDQQSFLKLERGAEDYLMGYMKTTRSIVAGYQPLIAYLLMKETQIRAVRMVLIGKKNDLSGRLLLDRLGTWMG